MPSVKSNVTDLGMGNLAVAEARVCGEEDKRTLFQCLAGFEHLPNVFLGVNLVLDDFVLRPVVLSDNPRLAVPLQKRIDIAEMIDNGLGAALFLEGARRTP